jgi:hypothetical protein
VTAGIKATLRERLFSPLGSFYAPASAFREALMWQRRLVSFAAGVVFAVIAILPAMNRAQTVDVAIALAADVSRSIDDEEFQLQRRGYAAAVTDPSSRARRPRPVHRPGRVAPILVSQLCVNVARRPLRRGERAAALCATIGV